TRPLRRYEDRRLGYVDLVDEDFLGEGERRAGEAPIFYELRNGKLAAAYPVFVDGRAPLKGTGDDAKPIQSGLLSDINRRQEMARREWLEQFVKAFGTDDDGEATTFDGTIPQALMMMNGELVKQATSTEAGSFLYRVAADDKLKNPAKMETLFLAAVARRPT